MKKGEVRLNEMEQIDVIIRKLSSWVKNNNSVLEQYPSLRSAADGILDIHSKEYLTEEEMIFVGQNWEISISQAEGALYRYYYKRG